MEILRDLAPVLGRPLVLVDVGCRWGVDPAWAAAPPEQLRVYAFDADADEARRLQAQAPANTTYVPTGLGARAGTRTLHVAEEPACSSLFPPDATSLRLFPELAVTREVARTEIEVDTLAGWAQRAGVETVDVMKLDVQGAELEVLEGAGSLLDGVRGLEVEVALNPMYEGQPLFGDVDAFLRSRGFRLWRLGHLVHYSLDGSASEAPWQTDRQFFDGVLVEAARGPGQVTWAHAIYVAGDLAERRSTTPQDAARDAAVASILDLPDLAGPARAAAHGTETFSADEMRRIELTTSARDCDAIPKVPDAGAVREHEGRRVQVMHNGLLVEEGGYCGSWMTEVIRRLRGHHEPQEEKAFHVVLERLAHDERAPVVVELGSYWAYYSLWARHVIPGARSLLVEPDETYLDVGRRNFALNGLDGEFTLAAVGGRHGEQIEFVRDSDGSSVTVPVVTVDGLLAEAGAGRCDLLLVDVQGAELDVLRGASGTIAAGGLRFVVLSTHHHLISGDPLLHDRCLTALRDAGAHIVCEHTVHESASGDGLVVASFDPRDRDLHVEVSHVRARDTLFGGLEPELAAALERARDAET